MEERHLHLLMVNQAWLSLQFDQMFWRLSLGVLSISSSVLFDMYQVHPGQCH
jgi:hypothetical protein